MRIFIYQVKKRDLRERGSERVSERDKERVSKKLKKKSQTGKIEINIDNYAKLRLIYYIINTTM
jgi:beta-lactamase regulating signal transducer with metallopeptidase domain